MIHHGNGRGSVHKTQRAYCVRTLLLCDYCFKHFLSSYNLTCVDITNAKAEAQRGVVRYVILAHYFLPSFLKEAGMFLSIDNCPLCSSESSSLLSVSCVFSPSFLVKCK